VRGSTLWFQQLQARYLLGSGKVSAPTVAAVAAKAGVDPAGLASAVAAYNASDPGDAMGKAPDLVRPLDQPPYSLIDCSIQPSMFYPAPVLTLGGLVVEPETGQVLRPDGTAVAGLYAAGRSAVGLCSGSYVSGLSLADCVFSGRRAGHHAARL
jgi:3-oxo-5alpha-steroid 4-dehydrogenase